jgi:branched-chain amino acid transport system ATP-binding protein
MSVLEVNHLKIQFGGLVAVDDFNLKIDENELVGLIGPNGAGKTTIFNLLTGVYKPTEGQIFISDQALISKKPNDIVMLGGARTFQNIRLFKNMTVIDNIKTAYHHALDYNFVQAIFKTRKFKSEEQKAQDTALELLKVFNMEEEANTLSKNLPYGKQRKLEILRALATQPKILLLDEPAAGMNDQETEELMHTIRFIKKEFGVSILLIEHDMKLVMGICERILVVDYGKTIAHGKPSEIRSNKAVIKAYLGD